MRRRRAAAALGAVLAAVLAAAAHGVWWRCAAAYPGGDCRPVAGPAWRRAARLLGGSRLPLSRPALPRGRPLAARPPPEAVAPLEAHHAALLAEWAAFEAGGGAQGGWEPSRFGLEAPSEPLPRGAVRLLSLLGDAEGPFPLAARLAREAARRHGAALTAAQYSVLRPGGRVPPHRGFERGRLTCHLPLRLEPGAAWLRVAGQEHRLEEGRAFCFDDYRTHEAGNDSRDRPRVVLWLQFRPRPAAWRPRWL